MKKSDLKIIKKINDEAWSMYGEDLLREELVAPDVKKLILAILKDKPKDVPEEKRKQLQALLDSGELDKKEYVVNEDISKKMDTYVQKRLVEEIKAGRLTNPKDDKNYQKFSSKIKQDARRKIKKAGVRKNDIRSKGEGSEE